MVDSSIDQANNFPGVKSNRLNYCGSDLRFKLYCHMEADRYKASDHSVGSQRLKGQCQTAWEELQAFTKKILEINTTLHRPHPPQYSSFAVGSLQTFYRFTFFFFFFRQALSVCFSRKQPFENLNDIPQLALVFSLQLSILNSIFGDKAEQS